MSRPNDDHITERGRRYAEQEQRWEALQQAADEIRQDRSFSRTFRRVAEEALQFRNLQFSDEGSGITSLQEAESILQTLAGSDRDAEAFATLESESESEESVASRYKSFTMIEASTITDSILTIEASIVTDSMVDACTETEPVKPTELAAPPPRPTKEEETKIGPPLRDYRAELREEQRWTKRHKQLHQDAIACLEEEASNRMAELKAQAEEMVHEQKEAMGRLQEQVAGKEIELKRKLEEYAATMAEKEKEVLDLHAALDYAKEWNLGEEERNRQREEKLVAENAELQSQRMTFKEIADEFFIKCKLLFGAKRRTIRLLPRPTRRENRRTGTCLGRV